MINKLPTDLKIDYILHIADIHVRLFKRHQEFRESFELLYRELRKTALITQNVAIVVAGDIVHSKAELSPEMISLTSDFLKTLSEIAPTIIIAGNHDTNLANTTRLDSLTPIIENIKSDNLFYLRDSGLYELENSIIGVFSILNDHSTWPLTPALSKKKKIALFHGPVYGAKTEVGYEIKSEDIKTSLFDGYDMVLLGDIHKYQVLEDGTNGPIVAYPGSLIQQDHGEGILGHTIILWDVNHRKMTPLEFDSNYSFVTWNFKNDKEISTTFLGNDNPKNIRARFIIENTKDETITKFVNNLKKEFNFIDISINKKLTLNSGDVDSKDVFGKDITDVNFQNDILDKFIDSRFPSTSKSLKDRVLTLNSHINKLSSIDDLPKSIVWRPIRMKFSNLFSYGENNEINFESLNGVIGIFAPNAYGKSSSFDALSFALYDKTPRATKGSQIMNTAKDWCSCELEFEINGERFFINRVGKKNKAGEVKIDVDFYKITKTGEQVSLNGTERRYTNNNIKSFVGEYDDFVLTTLSVQGNNNLFIDRGQSERKDVLGQFIGLSIFDRLHATATEQSKETSVELTKLKKNDYGILRNQLEQNLDELKTKSAECQTEVSKTKEHLELVESAIKNLLEQKIPVQIPTTDINGLHKLQAQLVAEISSDAEKVQSLFQSIELLVTQKASLNIDESVLGELEQRQKDIETKKQLVTKSTTDISYVTLKIDECNRKISKLAGHKYDPNCQFCIENVFVKDAKLAEAELVKLNEQKRIMEEALEVHKSSIPSDDYTSQIAAVKTEIAKKLKLEREIVTLNDTRNATTLRIEKNDSKLTQTNAAIQSYLTFEQAILSNSVLDVKIQEHETTKRHVSNLLKLTESKDKQLYGEIKVTENKITQLNDEMARLKELESNFEAYDLYIKCMHRDGIPYHLMKEVLPVIQGETNNILSQMTDFIVELDMDGKNVNAQIVYDQTKKWSLELASGMEKFVSSLAIRAALMKISNLPRSTFLIIDEGLGTLDPDNLNSVASIFSYLKTQFSFIFLISHLDAARDIADIPVDISRIDGLSYIKIG